MGYSHCWLNQPGSAAYAAAWPNIVQDSNRIVAEVSRRIPIAGPDGTGVPVLSATAGIAYNGGPGQHRDTFALAAPGTSRRRWHFCKTEQLPYDVAVTATLLRCHLLLPDSFLLYSEGDWDTDWQPARRLVRRLFGLAAAGTPFTEAALPPLEDPAWQQ